MFRFFKWFKWFLFAPSVKPITEDPNQIYDKLIDLERRISVLENENVETTNSLYELSNSIEAVDVRIDILTAEKWIDKNV